MSEATKTSSISAPVLMEVCRIAGRFIKLPPKEVWKMMDIPLSYQLNKPQIDLERLDEYLYQDVPEDREISSSDLLIEKYGQEARDFIFGLV